MNPPENHWRVEYRRRLAEAGVTDSVTLSREAARDILTDRRIELIDALSTQADAIGSVSDLAEHVERDISIVSRDLTVLYEAGVIDYERDGRNKKPVLSHSTILVEPVMFDGKIITS